MESFEYTGTWWLPSSPTTKIAGILSFSEQRGAILKLVGSFDNFFTGAHGSGSPVEYPVILGMSNNGKLFTLINCVQREFSVSFPGMTTEEIRAQDTYLGIHIDDPADLSFPKLTVEYTYLRDWIHASGFLEHHDRSADHTFVGYGVTFTFPEPVTFVVDGDKIEFEAVFHQSKTSRFEKRLFQTAQITITAPEALSRAAWQKKYLAPLQNFLTLATGRPNAVQRVRFYTQEPQADSSEKPTRERPVELYFQPIYLSPQAKEDLQESDMLFTLRDVKDNTDLMKRWLDISKDLDSVCNLFFSTRYNNSMYLDARFLFIAQAAESYHRRRFPGSVLPKKEHKARVKSILKAIPTPNERCQLSSNS